MYRSVIPSCSLCNHFDAVAGVCTLDNKSKVGYDIESPKVCISEAKYVRYLNVIPNIFNYYYPEEQLPPIFSPDLSKVARDKDNRPLVVQTRRGLERAIPVEDNIELMVNPLFGTVDRLYTINGQFELIRLLGFNYVKDVAFKHNVVFIGTEEEAHYEGSLKERRKFKDAERLTQQLKTRR